MMPNTLFKNSAYGRLLLSAQGIGPALTMATFGDSHMASYFVPVHQLALAQHHDANIMYDARPVFVGEGDSATTVQASPGAMYAVGASTSAHMINTQLVKFEADVAAGKRFDIGISDGALYNDLPGGQDFTQTATRLQQLIDAFLSPTGNNGMAFIVFGTFSRSPSLCRAWANYWQRKADASGGRIHFVDTASAVIDPKLATSANFATTAPAWANRGGTGGSFGSAFSDGAHLSHYGASLVAPALADAYRHICPRVFPRPASYATQNYDAAGYPYSDLLGPGAGMVGTAGIDLTTNNGDYNGLIPGTGHGGVNALFNRWMVTFNGISKPNFSITTSPSGGFQQTIELVGAVPSGGGSLRYEYTPVIANPNSGDATRRFMLGCEIEYVGVTGAYAPSVRVAGTWMTGLPASGDSHALPDATNARFKLRTLTPFAVTAANPTVTFHVPFRGGAAAGGGVIRIRDPFFRLVA